MILCKSYLSNAVDILNQLLAEPLHWDEGRQQTGYHKASLKKDLPCIQSLVDLLSFHTSTKVETFDSYLIHYKAGSYIPIHTDDVVFGQRHVRANVILQQPERGGWLFIGTPGLYIPLKVGDIFIFEPNIIEHSVTICGEDRYVLSVGTLI